MFRARFVAIENSPPASLIAEKWRRTYWKDGAWGSTIDGPAVETYKKLRELGDDTSSDKIRASINGSWTLECDGCGNVCDQAVRIGEAGSTESRKYCATCIREASDILAQGQRPLAAAGKEGAE